MNTLQLSRDLSVRQIAAIVKRLSREDKDKLMDMIWDHVFDVPKDVQDGLIEWLQKQEENPSRMIPLEEAAKQWRLKS